MALFFLTGEHSLSLLLSFNIIDGWSEVRYFKSAEEQW